MQKTRIYQPTPLALEKSITLSDEASHHLLRVLRYEIGDEFILFNGEGGEYTAKIIEIQNKKVKAQIENFENKSVESPLKIHLVQAIARGEKMDYVIQKAVELGVTKVTPMITERCGVKLSQERWEKKLQHWQSVIISACEQSGRNFVPEIVSPQSFESVISNANEDLKILLHPESRHSQMEHVIPAKAGISFRMQRSIFQEIPAFAGMTDDNSKNNVICLIGPEGGFSETEVELAKQQKFETINLGPRILRTETAALVAVTALQCAFGDLK